MVPAFGPLADLSWMILNLWFTSWVNEFLVLPFSGSTRADTWGSVRMRTSQWLRIRLLIPGLLCALPWLHLATGVKGLHLIKGLTWQKWLTGHWCRGPRFHLDGGCSSTWSTFFRQLDSTWNRLTFFQHIGGTGHDQLILAAHLQVLQDQSSTRRSPEGPLLCWKLSCRPVDQWYMTSNDYPMSVVQMDQDTPAWLTCLHG